MATLLLSLTFVLLCLLACIAVAGLWRKPRSSDRRVLVVLGSGAVHILYYVDLSKTVPGHLQQLPILQQSQCRLAAGGHTAEMLALLKTMGHKPGTSRAYVVAATDKMSAEKARLLERSFLDLPSIRVSQIPTLPVQSICLLEAGHQGLTNSVLPADKADAFSCNLQDTPQPGSWPIILHINLDNDCCNLCSAAHCSCWETRLGV